MTLCDHPAMRSLTVDEDLPHVEQIATIRGRLACLRVLQKREKEASSDREKEEAAQAAGFFSEQLFSDLEYVLDLLIETISVVERWRDLPRVEMQSLDELVNSFYGYTKNPSGAGE